MFFPHGFAKVTDWPGVAAIGAPKPLYIQYCSEDALFTKEGMHRADDKISAVYEGYGFSLCKSISETNKSTATQYCGKFYPVGHSFTIEMQDDAFTWLNQNLHI